jgi:hypothetical protein
MSKSDRLALVDAALDKAISGAKPGGACRAQIEGDLLTVSSHIKDKETGDAKVVKLLEYDVFLTQVRFQTDSSIRQDKSRLAAALAYLKDKHPSVSTPSNISSPSPAGRAIESVISTAGSLTISRSPSSSCKGSVTTTIVAFPVHDREEAESAISTLKLDPAVSGATCLAHAWLLPGGSSSSHDGGEKKFGTTALAKLGELKAKGCAVLVARFWGGEECGKARFQHIRDGITVALTDAGHMKGEKLEEAGWRNGGVGMELGGGGGGGGEGGGSDKPSVGELRRKRLAALEGGGGGGKKKSKPEPEVIELLDSSSDEELI